MPFPFSITIARTAGPGHTPDEQLARVTTALRELGFTQERISAAQVEFDPPARLPAGPSARSPLARTSGGLVEVESTSAGTTVRLRVSLARSAGAAAGGSVILGIATNPWIAGATFVVVLGAIHLKTRIALSRWLRHVVDPSAGG